MKLKLVYDTLDEIESSFHPLYTERDGKFHLTGVEGMKTQTDIDRVQEALRKEREDHKATRSKYAPIADLDLTEVVAKLDKYDELELLASKNKLNNDELETLVEKRVKGRLTPLERELAARNNELQEATKTLESLQKEKIARTINDSIRAAAAEAKMLPEAIDDALLLGSQIFEIDELTGEVVSSDRSGMAGLAPSVWLQELQDKKPHWWPSNSGGGARGGTSGGGPNPWSHDGWNLTEQGKIYMQNASKAEQLAKAAGTTVGGQRPVKK